MTKYSKIKKSSFAILALSLILVAVLAFGGTYAFFTDKAVAQGGTTMGKLNFGASESITIAEQSWVPNQQIGITGVDLTYTENNVVAVMKATVEITGKNANTVITVNNSALVTAGWLADTEVKTDGKYTQDFYFSKAFIGSNAEGTNAPQDLDGVTLTFASTAGNEYQGEAYTIKVTIEMVQAEYTDDSVTTTYTNGKTFTQASDVKAVFSAAGTAVEYTPAG